MNPFRSRFWFVLLVAVLLMACHSAGPYGHAVSYVPLSDEDDAVKSAKEYDPVMFQRMPEEWHKKPVTLFGVVTSRTPGQNGAAYVTLSVRRLEPRNLCQNMNDDDTCRVTVSDRDFGVVHALITLRPDDDVGPKSVGVSSLVRLVGTFGEEVDTGDGGPILRATFYRHWPPFFFVTKSAARDMRQ
ncbi:MAG: hypothetical protein ABI461_13480 [Polyangiaceae bacterium]